MYAALDEIKLRRPACLDAATLLAACQPTARTLYCCMTRSEASYNYTSAVQFSTRENPGGGGLLVSMIPRYPLLGGWQTELVLGYSLPLESAVLKAGKKRTLVFLVPPLLQLVRSRCDTSVSEGDLSRSVSCVMPRGSQACAARRLARPAAALRAALAAH
jgi:Ribophorin I